MTTEPTTDGTGRHWKAVRDLQPHEHILSNGLGLGAGVREVRIVEPAGDGYATVLFVGGQVLEISVDHQVGLATEAEVEVDRTARRRMDTAHALGRLATCIVDHQLDLPQMNIALHVDSREELDRIAKALGVPVDEPAPYAHYPRLTWKYPAGREFDAPIQVFADGPREPDPEPAPLADKAEPLPVEG